MPSIFVAVGSLRQPKLAAVRAALEICGPHLVPGAQFEVVGVDSPSGVRHTPLSRIETLRGACNRAESLKRLAHERGEAWQYFVGLEGGLEILVLEGQRHVFLENWACVMDLTGRVHYGQSGAIALPQELAARVVDEGTELADAVDVFAGARGIRNGLGAWGVLTHGAITREDAFRIAAINAFAPFFASSRAAP